MKKEIKVKKVKKEEEKVCKVCNGTGYIPIEGDPNDDIRDCPECKI